jgi:hypothetical protein
MKRRLLALAMIVAMFGLVAQGSTAQAFLLRDRSPSVTAAQIVVGGAMTGAYFALTYRNGKFTTFGQGRTLQWYGLTSIGCMALTPILGGALVGHYEQRELRSSEVFIMLGDCVVPILGGLFWKAVFDANPEWDARTGGPAKR